MCLICMAICLDYEVGRNLQKSHEVEKAGCEWLGVQEPDSYHEFANSCQEWTNMCVCVGGLCRQMVIFQ
jgi:hypothetical protein